MKCLNSNELTRLSGTARVTQFGLVLPKLWMERVDAIRMTRDERWYWDGVDGYRIEPSDVESRLIRSKVRLSTCALNPASCLLPFIWSTCT